MFITINNDTNDFKVATNNEGLAGFYTIKMKIFVGNTVIEYF